MRGRGDGGCTKAVHSRPSRPAAPIFSLVLIAGLSSLASLDRAIPDRGKHGSPPTWPWNAWTFSRGNWEWGTSGVSERGVSNAISFVALDFIALDIMQIGFASCGLVVLGTSRAFFTDYHRLQAEGGGWTGKGRDSMAVFVDAACSRGIACDAQKRRSTATVSRPGTGGEAVSAEAAGDVIDDASRDRGGWSLVPNRRAGLAKYRLAFSR